MDYRNLIALYKCQTEMLEKAQRATTKEEHDACIKKHEAISATVLQLQIKYFASNEKEQAKADNLRAGGNNFSQEKLQSFFN